MLVQRVTDRVTQLSDEQLLHAIAATERCARCMTRNRRDAAVLQLRCLRCEWDRRRSEHTAESPVL